MIIATLITSLVQGCSDGTDRFRVNTPPPPEPIERSSPDLQPLFGVQFPWFTPQGNKLLASARSADFGGVHIVSFGLAGEDIACLTCAIWNSDVPLLKPIPFQDGRRAIIRVGRQSPILAADHAILECTPSLEQCDSAQLLPIQPAGIDDSNVVQDQREFRPAPDGIHVAYSQVRRSSSGGLVLIGIFGELQRLDERYEVINARVVSDGVEAKGISQDGQNVIVARFTNAFDAANPDVVSVSLATGQEQRITYALDYDEPLEYSPDGAWFIVGSGRGSGSFEAVSQLQRPGFINPGLDALLAPIFLNRRAELLEPWLVDQFGAREDYIGQQLNPDSLPNGWNARSITNWSPDGTRAVTWEERLENPAETRIALFHFSARSAADRATALPSPDPDWAPPLTGFVPSDVHPASSRDGRFSGFVEVSFSRGEPNELTVTFSDFSDDGEWIINGVEQSQYTEGLGSTAVYSADLELSGAHSGFLRADRVSITASSIAPAIVSEVDGRRLELAIP